MRACVLPACNTACNTACRGRLDDREDGLEDGGARERDAAEFDGDVQDDVGRGQEVRRQVREGGERHAADLEDVVERDDDDEDGDVIAGREDAFVSRDLPFG